MTDACWDEVPEHLREHIGNGCGPGWLPDWFPDGPFRESCVCCEHDFYYTAGGNHWDFLWTEVVFRTRLLSVAWAVPSLRGRLFWTFVALTYSEHTRTWGYRTSWTKRIRPLSTEETLKQMGLI